ncbi:conserved hypothetical protein [uncultured Sporomusa sp.]|uniref:Uncharacterized protein n=1 Tax=uncultured Sporomusa sp. TaxID=307249 RepID=A0A212LWF0_9FIRM|nr:DUF1904 family protein [uncultured Sporomusa sp.]SCM81831.1 conserved hypothetical protein [uncultured Sporomusa sp.]
MPQITMRGMTPEAASSLAGQVKNIVVNVTGTAANYVTLEYIPSLQLDTNGICASFAKLDILWLTGRPQAMHDAVAKALTELFRQNGFDRLQITFTNMPPAYFYDNGEHY